jgi:hypothetical protein
VPYIENGFVQLPRAAPWLNVFLREILERAVVRRPNRRSRLLLPGHGAVRPLDARCAGSIRPP